MVGEFQWSRIRGGGDGRRGEQRGERNGKRRRRIGEESRRGAGIRKARERRGEQKEN